MTYNQKSDLQVFLDGLMPAQVDRDTVLRSGKSVFIHYTSAEAAKNIIENGTFWLRGPRTMNDFSEIEHGDMCWRSMWDGEVGRRARKVLTQNGWSSLDEFSTILDATKQDLLRESYIASVCEHTLGEVDRGLLSMWRAYGSQHGVGLVMNPKAFDTYELRANLFSTAVFYADAQTYAGRMTQVLDGIENDPRHIRSVPEAVQRLLLEMIYIMALISVKHPSFREEREWRVFHVPKFYGMGIPRVSTDALNVCVKSIRGLPQKVAEVNFDGLARAGIANIALNDFLMKVIVGPTEYPDVVGDALEHIMLAAKMTNPKARIVQSHIPVRTNAT